MIRKLSSALSLILVVAMSLSLAGCNYLHDAQNTSNVLGTILAVAQADAGIVPAPDQAIYNNFVNLGLTLHTQLNTCIAAAPTGTKSAFLTCFNAFAGGLTSPTELAELRLLSPATQAKVQLIVAAVIAAVDIIESELGGTTLGTPSISSPVSSQQLHDFAIRAGLGPDFDRYAQN
jgi:hypothetical protein